MSEVCRDEAPPEARCKPAVICPTNWNRTARPQIPPAHNFLLKKKSSKKRVSSGNNQHKSVATTREEPAATPRSALSEPVLLPVISKSTRGRRIRSAKRSSARKPTKALNIASQSVGQLSKQNVGPSVPAGAFAPGMWENELARQILILYGSAVKNGDKVHGTNTDFAIDEDAVVDSTLQAKAAQRESSTEDHAVGHTSECALRKRTFTQVLPSKVQPVWFLGSGSLCAEWSALGESDEFAQQLGALEEAGQYHAYVEAVSDSLKSYAQHIANEHPGDLFGHLWRQLVVAANVFGIKCIDQQRYADALELLKTAQTLVAAPEYLSNPEMAQLKAFIADSHAYYYHKRGKANAALVYATRAMRIHMKLAEFTHVAKCHLHIAVVLSRMSRHAEAVRCLGQVLHLVKTGKLDIGADGTMPHKLCMIAICYHNLAVEQLLLNHAGEAAVSAQNARRLARLCLSYSNRWIHKFESTHKCATEQLAAMGSALAVPSPGPNREFTMAKGT